MKRLTAILIFTLVTFKSLANPGDSLKLFLKTHSTEDSLRVSALLKYGKSLFFTRQDSMMYYADEALRIAQKLHWQKGIADAYQLKGVSYSYVLSDPANAVDYYQKALVANEPLGRKEFEWQTLANIALIHYDQKDYTKALNYYNKAQSVLATLTNKDGEGRLLMNLGHLYFDLGKPDEAMQSYRHSLAFSERIGDSMAIANLLNSMGYILLQKNENEEARNLVTKSINIAELTGNMVTKASALVNLSLIYLNTKHFDLSEKYAKEALALSKETGNLQFQRQSWDALRKIYEQTGRFEQSLMAYKSYNQLNDSLVNIEKNKEITRKEMQFQFDKKQAIDQAEIQRQRALRNMIIVSTAILILGAMVAIVLYKNKRDAVEKKKEAEFKLLVANTERKALRAQMNPHFIFNSLNAISDYILKNNTQLADEYLSKFAGLMRMVLENSMEQEILLSEEIKALKFYMDLESLRLDHRFIYEIKTAPGIDPENILVPPLLFQPFIENSIKHGLSEKQDGGKITIDLTTESNMLICNIVDNGAGFGNTEKTKAKTSLSNHKSRGISITRSRIEILNTNRKNGNASMNIYPTDTGTRVEIKLPLVLNFDS